MYEAIFFSEDGDWIASGKEFEGSSIDDVLDNVASKRGSSFLFYPLVGVVERKDLTSILDKVYYFEIEEFSGKAIYEISNYLSNSSKKYLSQMIPRYEGCADAENCRAWKED